MLWKEKLERGGEVEKRGGCVGGYGVDVVKPYGFKPCKQCVNRMGVVDKPYRWFKPYGVKPKKKHIKPYGREDR